jgi:nuclear pore complex protein Nup160
MIVRFALQMLRYMKANPFVASANPWKETFHNVQGWAQGLRSLLPFQGSHTIKHGKVNMELSAASSVQVNSLGLDDSLFLFTVCLDHRMRIWNLQNGQILYTGDILNADRNPQEIGKWTIDPAQFNLIQIVNHGVGQRICATYSPVGAGEFKFWILKVIDENTLSVEDAFPDIRLIPQVPSSSDVWTLADFVLSKPLDGVIQLWTMWKNNMTYRVQRLEIDREHMEQSWQSDWDGVHVDTHISTAETSGPCDATDSTEKWLQHILYPGRFTKSTLETALSIYERAPGSGTQPGGNSRGSKGLAEAICSALGSTASLDRRSAGGMDYEQFRATSEIQWRRFFRLLLELDKQRGEAISLVLDADSEMTWVVCADAISAIRECSALERVYHNFSNPDEASKNMVKLISAGLVFVEGFSDNIWQVCNAVLRPELFEEVSKTELERIQYFNDKAAFWRSITDEDCLQVVDNLGENFTVVTNQLYDQVLDLIAATLDARHKTIRHPLTEFGRKLVVKAVQETIELQWKICFSQLILLVHMEFEYYQDQEEDALHTRVDVGAVFRQLVTALRRLELLKWLAKTEILVPIFTQERPGSVSGGSPSASKRAIDEYRAITALEGNIGHLLGFGNIRNEPLASSLTDIIANLCAPDSDIEVSTALIQCSLIRRERADLALELIPFCDQNPFSVYVKGRVFLALKDYTTAAIHFRKAAIGMSKYLL